MLNRKTNRYRLKPEEVELIDHYRGIKDACDTADVDIKNVSHGWLKTKDASLFFRNPSVDLNQLKKELIEELKNYSPAYPNIKRKQLTNSHLLVVDPADVHIGKLSSSFETGESYDSQIAVKRVLEGVQGLINQSAGFNINQIVFVIGNDILHVDTPKSSTTAGTIQDTHGMWYDNFLIGKKLYVDIIEMLMQIANVHVVFCPSNHDFMSGFFLADTLGAWFRKSKNVTFDISMQHRKYYSYGNNCIGFTHGDGAKTQDLPLLMAQETHYWSNPKRYIYTHHVHHKTSKDYGSVCVESLRSPSAADSWHHRNGYQHAPKAIEAFLHHPLHGQTVRLTHYF
jgi:hypothetical protein